MEKEFEFSIKGNTVEDLKSIMQPVNIENINKGLAKELNPSKTESVRKCDICGSTDSIDWMDETADFDHIGINGVTYTLQNGSCHICGWNQYQVKTEKTEV